MTEQGTPPPPPGAPVPPPAGAPAAPADSAGPVSPVKKSGAGKKIVGILAIVLGFIVVAGVKFGVSSFFSEDDKTAEAKVGDCVANLPELKEGEEKEVSGAEVVDCASTDAAYSVVGRLENLTAAEASTTKDCEQYLKEGDSYTTYYSIPAGGKGYVLCLKPKS